MKPQRLFALLLAGVLPALALGNVTAQTEAPPAPPLDEAPPDDLADAPGLSIRMPESPSAAVSNAFTYQGQLKKASAAYIGQCDFTFTLWDSLNGGNTIDAVNNKPAVGLFNGLFTVELDFGSGAFTGDERYLAMTVRCPAGSGNYTALVPRQRISVAPFALTLRPGALITGTAYHTLEAENSYTGGGLPIAVIGTVVTGSNGVGVFGINDSDVPGGAGIGVYGRTSSPNGRGVYGLGYTTATGVRGSSTSGIGVYGTSAMTGVLGSSSGGIGVYGRASGADDYGVMGEATNGTNARGVYGLSTDGRGVFGQSSTDAGVYGISNSGHGVYGDASGTTASGVRGFNGGQGYGVTGKSTLGIGIEGESAASDNIGVHGIANTGGGATGVLGESAAGTGIKGQSSGTDRVGVYGEANTGSGARGAYGFSAEGTGVKGESTGAGRVGVYGVANTGNGARGVLGVSAEGSGVKGDSTSGNGVYGTSAISNGVYGFSAGSGGMGVYGEANTGSSARGVYGFSASGTGVRGESTGANRTGVYGAANDGASARGVYGVSADGSGVYGTSTTGTGVYGIANGAASAGVKGESSGWIGVFGLNDSTASSGAHIGVAGETHSTSSSAYAVQGYASGNNATGVRGIANAGGVGVIGENTSTGTGVKGISNGGFGVEGEGAIGVSGDGGAAGIGLRGSGVDGEGIYGTSTNDDGVLGVTSYTGIQPYDAAGVCGEANGPGAAGILGINNGGGLAGRFAGDVRIYGTVYANGAILDCGSSFCPASPTANEQALKIDHPLDPENQYLVHASVSSDEMKTLYDGTAVLDENGETAVPLPDWFEAVNTNLRYQLTAIGAPGPNLYIAQEVQDNQFKIAGGKPGMKVSWQISGARKDAFAQAHPLQVERAKSAEEKGKYLYPEVYGKPKTAAVVTQVR